MTHATDIEIRRATHDDYEGVAAFTRDLWDDHGGDYLHHVYHDWLEDEDDDHKRTFLATVGDDVAGIVQAVMLSPDEAWFQGMRVNPAYRRQGVSRRLNEAGFEWAIEQGATVGRLMTFSWNVAALGAARAGGFAPETEFRFAQPDPDHDADGPHTVSTDPDAAWRFWTTSNARTHLRGLTLDADESWAMRDLTRDDLATLADDTAVFAVDGDTGVSGMAYRSRDYERENDDGETVHWAEYGVGAWADVPAAKSLFAAIARDAAELGADETRVLIPETVTAVSDASYAGADLSDEPDFVLGIDLTNY
ncbi:N-acetyltransferase GCN5 [Halovivax asiaticus JCM 14624]|uniref:N-acetyltransferase GCN5 n=1 Tax=Halovivax asiaticus JCM 14624 TaxID=1227490 RepID=M0BR36_9EURY|nr:GNAT family N-acetyltransferase [Halovivax asiaticus]ELZ12144.1 N-acetyltransferase GCN5 [Halovivax asiaticus JCM 14624]